MSTQFSGPPVDKDKKAFADYVLLSTTNVSKCKQGKVYSSLARCRLNCPAHSYIIRGKQAAWCVSPQMLRQEATAHAKHTYLGLAKSSDQLVMVSPCQIHWKIFLATLIEVLTCTAAEHIVEKLSFYFAVKVVCR